MHEESLRELIGLCLELAQELLPQKCCDGHLGSTKLGPYFHFSVVVCRLPFKTGLSTWAPLAPLMGELCFSPCGPGKLIMMEKEFHGSDVVPKVDKYISLLNAHNRESRPFWKVYVLAPGWENSKHWLSSKWVHPR